ncbi:MAG TPA: hypothetical protein P5048_00600 [Chlamydiales bacterium]|nr:hypothetical protein [Chlamydiales bacterium]
MAAVYLSGFSNKMGLVRSEANDKSMEAGNNRVQLAIMRTFSLLSFSFYWNASKPPIKIKHSYSFVPVGLEAVHYFLSKGKNSKVKKVLGKPIGLANKCLPKVIDVANKVSILAFFYFGAYVYAAGAVTAEIIDFIIQSPHVPVKLQNFMQRYLSKVFLGIDLCYGNLFSKIRIVFSLSTKAFARKSYLGRFRKGLSTDEMKKMLTEKGFSKRCEIQPSYIAQKEFQSELPCTNPIASPEYFYEKFAQVDWHSQIHVIRNKLKGDERLNLIINREEIEGDCSIVAENTEEEITEIIGSGKWRLQLDIETLKRDCSIVAKNTDEDLQELIDSRQLQLMFDVETLKEISSILDQNEQIDGQVLKSIMDKLSEEQFLKLAIDSMPEDQLIVLVDGLLHECLGPLVAKRVVSGIIKDYDTPLSMLSAIETFLKNSENQVDISDILLRLAIDGGGYCGPRKLDVIEEIYLGITEGTLENGSPMKVLAQKLKIDRTTLLKKSYGNILKTSSSQIKKIFALDDLHTYNAFSHIFGKIFHTYNISAEQDLLALDEGSDLSDRFFEFCFYNQIKQQIFPYHGENIIPIVQQLIGEDYFPKSEFYNWLFGWVEKQKDLNEEEKNKLRISLGIMGTSPATLFEVPVEDENGKINPVFIKAYLVDIGVMRIGSKYHLDLGDGVLGLVDAS